MYYQSEYSTVRKGVDWTNLVLSIALIYILFDVVVSITYGATDTLLALKDEAIPEAQEGNKLRQILYLFAILICVGAAFIKKTVSVSSFVTAIPFSYMVALVWAVSSSAWAIDPAISLRRSLLMIAILFPVCMIVHQLGTVKVLKIVYGFFVFVLLASFISVLLNRIPLFEFSIHPQGELDPAVSGAWRGIMSHKNGAGPVLSHAAFVFFFHAIVKKRVKDYVFFTLCLVFIFFTKSKTSLGLLMFCIFLGLIYRAYVERGGLLVWQLVLLTITVAATTIAFSASDLISAFFSNYQNLTGRVGIWTSMMFYIQEHPWLGSGYGSFWGIGPSSPIYDLAVEQYITKLGTSHNGYLEILATTGIIGLALVLFALVVMPFVRFARAPRGESNVYGLFFTMWIFGILQNLTESQIFSPEKQSWIFVVIAMVCIYSEQTTAPRTRSTGIARRNTP